MHKLILILVIVLIIVFFINRKSEETENFVTNTEQIQGNESNINLLQGYIDQYDAKITEIEGQLISMIDENTKANLQKILIGIKYNRDMSQKQIVKHRNNIKMLQLQK